MKDVPAEDRCGDLEIICWFKRENPREALLSNSGSKFLIYPRDQQLALVQLEGEHKFST